MQSGDLINAETRARIICEIQALLGGQGRLSAEASDSAPPRELSALRTLAILVCLHLFQRDDNQEFGLEELKRFLAEFSPANVDDLRGPGAEADWPAVKERLQRRPDVIDEFRDRVGSCNAKSFYEEYFSRTLNPLLEDVCGAQEDGLVPKVGKVAKMAGKKTGNKRGRYVFQLRWRSPRRNVPDRTRPHERAGFGSPSGSRPHSSSGDPSRCKIFNVPSPPPQGIHGRESDAQNLSGKLVATDSPASDYARVALLGCAGIGKTTLAIKFGHDVVEAFPDGVLWAALGPTPSVRKLLNDWGKLLNVDLTIEADEARCSDRLRDALHRQRVLLLVDDVWDVNRGKYFDVVDPSRGRIVFTTREPNIAHTLATRDSTIRLNVLDPESSLEILARLVGNEIRDRRECALRLCQRLGFLPLALTLAGRLLANEADVSPARMERVLGELTERTTGRQARLNLRQDEGRLGLLSGDQPVSLRAILAMSVDRLEKRDQERFALLADLGAEPLRWELDEAAAVWGLWEGGQRDSPEAIRTLREAEDSVSRLVARGLVERDGSSYHMHALLADFAAELWEDLAR